MDPPSTQSSSSKGLKAFSCVRCFERKVKCDKQNPCTNCARSSTECVFRIPPAPRRRKKRTQEEILKARLERYEKLLHAKGINPQADHDHAETDEADDRSDLKSPTIIQSPERRVSRDGTRGLDHEPGPPIGSEGRHLYIENGLWAAVGEEFQRPSDALPESSDEEDEENVPEDNIDFVLSLTPSPYARDLHPRPEQISKYWQIFLTNFNPLTKIIHVPTLQGALSEASNNLEKVPRGLECLMFAVYSAAVLTLNNDECMATFGESRKILLSRYRTGTKIALTKARFLGSADLTVLQAFTIHLLTMRDVYDARTLWTLAGVAGRLGEGIGLHRDGTQLGLNPFETELRRRLYWQITNLDFRSAQLSGSDSSGSLATWRVGLPTNVNDTDIYPEMTAPPEPRLRQSEMMFCSLRYEMAYYWKGRIMEKQPDGDVGVLWKNFLTGSSGDEKEKAVDELEALLESKYVRFCDPSDPLEFATSLVARAATNSMRLMAGHPRRYGNDQDIPDGIRQRAWVLSIKLLESDIVCHSSPSIRGFTWHIDYYFQWHALIYILEQLRANPKRDQVDKAWKIVEDVYTHHPAFITDYKKPIHLAVGSLCIKAFSAKVEAYAEKALGLPLQVPEYIKTLRQQRQNSKEKNEKPIKNQSRNTTENSKVDTFTPGGSAITDTQSPVQQMASFHSKPPQNWQGMQPMQPVGWEYSSLANGAEMDFSMMQMPVEDTPMDWSQWDQLLQDFHVPNTTYR